MDTLVAVSDTNFRVGGERERCILSQDIFCSLKKKMQIYEKKKKNLKKLLLISSVVQDWLLTKNQINLMFFSIYCTVIENCSFLH